MVKSDHCRTELSRGEVTDKATGKAEGEREVGLPLHQSQLPSLRLSVYPERQSQLSSSSSLSNNY